MCAIELNPFNQSHVSNADDQFILILSILSFFIQSLYKKYTIYDFNIFLGYKQLNTIHYDIPTNQIRIS